MINRYESDNNINISGNYYDSIDNNNNNNNNNNSIT